MHGRMLYYVGREWLEAIERGMARPKAHYTMVIKIMDRSSPQVELVDLPFVGSPFPGASQRRLGAEAAGGEQNGSGAAGAGVAGKALAREAESWSLHQRWCTPRLSQI